jgi:hypothetical protein
MGSRFLFALAGLALGAGAAWCQSPSGPPPSPYAVPTLTPAEPVASPAEPAGPPANLSVPASNGSPRWWLQADYLLWWVKHGPLPTPLAVTGSLADDFPGALDQPNTQILFGGSGLRYRTVPGVRLGGGFWLDSDQILSVEASGFLLDRRSTGFAASTDADGNPVLGQPFTNALTGNPNVYLVGFPEFPAITGGLAIASHSRLSGWEINAGLNVLRGGNLSLTLLTGFRALQLDEDLQIASTFATQQIVDFDIDGNPITTPFSGSTFDQFRVSNRFYGGQVGGRLLWASGAWTVGVDAKVALGATQQLAQLTGASVVNNNGAISTFPLGVYVGPSNMGRFYRSDFAVAPEVGVNVGFKVSERVTARVGYSFLYLSRVSRPGDLVDLTINPNGVPTDPNSFGTPGGPARPAFGWHPTDFWAQGINFGLEFRY